MAISSDIIRGHTDMIILANLMEKDSYGYRINRDIQDKTEYLFELKEATLYSAFRRMEKEGLIASYWGGEDLGARRRYYSITDEGKTAFESYCEEWEKAKAMIDKLICWKEEA